jgi:hypothetical protein
LACSLGWQGKREHEPMRVGVVIAYSHLI